MSYFQVALIVIDVAATILLRAHQKKPPGPKINVSGSDYGQAWPLVYGTIAVPTNAVAAGPLIKKSTTDKKSGQTVTNYSVTLDLGLCRGPIDDVLRIWADADLIYDKRPNPTKLDKKFTFSLRVYPGDEDQLPDPAMQEIQGDTANAYRGLAHMVLERFPIWKFGNRVPQFRVEVAASPAPSYPFTVFNPWTETDGVEQNDARFMYLDQFEPYAYVLGKGASGGDEITRIDAITAEPIFSAEIDWDGAGLHDAIGAGENAPLVGAYYTSSLFTAGDYGNGVQFVELDRNSLSFRSRPWTGAGAFNIGYMDIGCSGHGDWVGITGTGAFGFGGGSYGIWHVSTGNVSYGFSSAVFPGEVFCNNFDASASWWCGGKNGKLYKCSVFDATGGTVFVAIFDTFEPFGVTSDTISSMSFNPDTNELTLFTETGKVVRFDTIGLAVSSEIGHCTNGTDINFGSENVTSSRRGWTTSTQFTNYQPTKFYLYDADADIEQAFEVSLWEVENLGGPNIFNELTSCLIAGRNSGGYGIYQLPRATAGTVSLETIMDDLAQQVGLDASQYDFTAFADTPVRGFVNLQRQAARALVEAIQPAFLFDVVEIGQKLVGTLRGIGDPEFVIPEDDLGAVDGIENKADLLNITTNDDLEISQEIDVTFYNADADYSQGMEPTRRNVQTNYSQGAQTVDLPLSLTNDEAATIGARLLALQWLERNSYKGTVGPSYLKLTPATVFAATRYGREHLIRTTKVTSGAPGVIEFLGCSEDTGVYEISAPGSDNAGFVEQGIVYVGPPMLGVLDTALLRQSDDFPGLYFAGGPAAAGGTFNGETVERSTDDVTFETVTSIPTASIMGNTNAKLATYARWPSWDRTNSVRVTLRSGTLSSCTEDDLQANLYKNLAFMGGELVQFATATLISGRTYDLSTLLRARFGTDAFVSTHAAGELFVLIDQAALREVQYPASEIGQTRYYKGFNQADQPFTPTQTIIEVTRRLLPYAPYFLRGTRDGSQNLSLSWLRRSRVPGLALWSPVLFESTEAYSIDILDGLGAIVRTLSGTLSGNGSGITSETGRTAYYAAADQVLDFGSTQADVKVKAYQLSGVIGRGYPRSADL